MKSLITKFENPNSINGKNVLLIAGVHGDEITPVYTLAKMIQYIKNFDGNIDNIPFFKNIKQLTILNGINMSGMIKSQRDVFNDNTLDLNRLLITDDNSNSKSILKEHVDNNDIVIDIHSSPNCTEFVLIDIDEYTNSIKKWCDLSNVQYAFRYSGANTIKRYCLENNKYGLTLEINQMKTIDFDSSENALNIIFKLLDRINIIPPLSKSRPNININELVELKTFTTGLVKHYFNCGQNISIGNILYDIYDLEFNLLYSHRSDINGIVICEPNKSFVSRGDVVYLIQPDLK